MKRFIVIGLGLLLILSGIFLIARFFLLGIKGKGALQVTSNVKSSVFLDGKLLGTTPLCKCKENETIKEGEYTVNVEPEDPSFETFSTKVTIHKDVLTAVDRTFLPGALASAYVLTLEKSESENPELLVLSIPDSAIVNLDGNPEGSTPFISKSVSASEHEIEIQKTGFNKKTLRIRTVPSYKLIAQVILGTEAQEINETPQTASPSASIQPTPRTIKGDMVKIKTTPVGFLRVREGPSTADSEIARVNPGEEYEFLDEDSGWYQIKLSTGEKGWVSATYAEKITSP